MQNPRLASRYAKALLDLAVERDCLDATLADIKLLDAICVQNPDFVSVLRSPVISSSKKNAIFDAVLEQQINKLTLDFIRLLIIKGREVMLPEMTAGFIAQYNTLKNIKIVKLKTAVAIDGQTKETIVAKINAFMPEVVLDLKLETEEDLIGGFVIEMDDRLYDASVKKGLADVKLKIMDYSYTSKL
jgi:F-type H+-transporting ATPase subunit delta